MILRKLIKSETLTKVRGALKRMLSIQRPALAGDDLDEVLCSWSKDDLLTVRDLLNGGVSIMGRVGSGKTSGSGKWLGEALVRFPRSGGLILCAKPAEDKSMWQRIFAEAGRGDDLLIFEPGGKLQLNFLDYVHQMGGDTREITKCVTTIGETLRSSDTNSGENSQFWEREQSRMIYNAVEIVKLASGRVTAPDLHRFITTAASSPAEITSDRWQKQFHCECLRKAFAAEKPGVAALDYQLAEAYWLAEIPGMDPRTRSSILVGVLGILHVFNTGNVRALASSDTNVSPEDMLAGRWVLVNMPPAQWGDAGNFINAGWKYLTQCRVLRRQAKPGDAINVIWCDEAQQFLNSFDAHYLAQCRSHLGSMVFLTQSIHSYYAALPGKNGHDQADALLTNFHHKVFHALGDAGSAEYASSLLGKDLQTLFGGSVAPQEELFDTLMGQSRFTGSFSQHYESVVQPNVFMNGLRTGGAANRFVVDAIAVRSGEPFSDGKNFMWVSFSQR